MVNEWLEAAPPWEERAENQQLAAAIDIWRRRNARERDFVVSLSGFEDFG